MRQRWRVLFLSNVHSLISLFDRSHCIPPASRYRRCPLSDNSPYEVLEQAPPVPDTFTAPDTRTKKIAGTCACARPRHSAPDPFSGVRHPRFLWCQTPALPRRCQSMPPAPDTRTPALSRRRQPMPVVPDTRTKKSRGRALTHAPTTRRPTLSLVSDTRAIAPV
jgi:hypothetical protein